MCTCTLYVRPSYANDSLFRILVNVANYFPSTSQMQFHVGESVRAVPSLSYAKYYVYVLRVV